MLSKTLSIGYSPLLIAACFMVVTTLPANIVFAKNTDPLNLLTIPSVGCQMDGQNGPVPASADSKIALPLTADLAPKLAYYQGILGPRNWYCFKLYGSNGDILFIAPLPLSRNLLLPDSKPFTGPVIQVSFADGETSGRFQAAQIIARIFPIDMAFVRQVIDEELEPESDFSFGPYPKDILKYKSDTTVEYQTPSHTRGLGTLSRLKENDRPIVGAAILLPDHSVNILAVRLPAEMSGLGPAIIKQFEYDAHKQLNGK